MIQTLRPILARHQQILVTESVKPDYGWLPRSVRVWIQVLLGLAILVTLVDHVVTLSRPLNYLHSWGVGGTILETRAFRTEGVLHLRGVPVIQNPPLGPHP